MPLRCCLKRKEKRFSQREDVKNVISMHRDGDLISSPEHFMSPSHQLRRNTIAPTDTCSSHVEPRGWCSRCSFQVWLKRLREREGERDEDWEKKKRRRVVNREKSKVEGGAAACDERLWEGRGEVLLSSLFSLRLDCSMSSSNQAAGVDSIISTYLHVKRLDDSTTPNMGQKGKKSQSITAQRDLFVCLRAKKPPIRVHNIKQMGKGENMSIEELKALNRWYLNRRQVRCMRGQNCATKLSQQFM